VPGSVQTAVVRSFSEVIKAPTSIS